MFTAVMAEKKLAPTTDAYRKQTMERMLKFIEDSANEDVVKSHNDAEATFASEKARLVEEQCKKITEYYARRGKQVELQRKIQASNMVNQARLRVLREAEQHIRNVMEEARRSLKELALDERGYRELLAKLVTQGLLQMLEPEVTVLCRPQDEALLDLDGAARHYRQATGGQAVRLSLEPSLPASASGGVELQAKRGRIRVCNTLEARLDMIAVQLLPQVRTALFGRNPNRKFTD